MKLLYILLNEKGEVLLYRGISDVSIPYGEGADINYGYYSPEKDNIWFLKNCGLNVYRRYVCFSQDYCIATFELHKTVELSPDFLWVNRNSLDEYIKDKTELLILKKTINNFDCSRNFPWVNKHGFKPYFEWIQSVAEHNKFTLTGELKQINNSLNSTVFMMSTSIGKLFLKIQAVPYFNDIEKVESYLTKQIYKLPEIIAVSPSKYAFLSREMLGEEVNNVDNTENLDKILKQWAIIQRKYSCTNETFNKIIPLLHDYTPQNLLSRLDTFSDEIEKLFHRINKPYTLQIQSKLNQKLSEVRELLDQFSISHLPNCLCHGDMRSNIRLVNGEYALFDWGMSVYAHPFFDVLSFLNDIRRPLTSDEKEKILDACFTQWEDMEVKESQRESYFILERLTNFFRLYINSNWLSEIEIISDTEITDCSIDSWLFACRANYFLKSLDRFLS